jgi:hypothetical protein
VKVEWLNRDLTEAIVTIGWWKWKRRTVVRWVEAMGSWVYRRDPSYRVGWEYASDLSALRSKEIAHKYRREVDAMWARDSEFPEARLLKP